ncbi:hypothetical protein PV326_011524, partial [Microctonus aethiopoides]
GQGGQPGSPGQGGQGGRPGAPGQGGQPGRPGQSGSSGQPSRPGRPGQPAQPVIPAPGCLADRGQFPSPNSCANYLNCWDETVIEQHCPDQLLFNDVTGLCDFEQNVNCGNRPGPTPKPSLPTGARKCPDLNGRYRSQTNCSEFYVCLAGSPIKFNCPQGLVYNDAVGVCDYPYNVDCQGAATPSPLPPWQPDENIDNSLTGSSDGSFGSQQTTEPPRQQPPPVTFPPSAYPQNQWSFRSQQNLWNQRPAASQIEIDRDQQYREMTAQTQNDLTEHDSTEISTIHNPWSTIHAIPADLTKLPCENGKIHRLDDACTSVVVCRNKRPQLVKCDMGLIYDYPSDSCRHFSIAKCH